MNVPAAVGASEQVGNPHLRSAREIAGYEVDANARTLGTITDFIVDDQRWHIHDLVVNVYEHKIFTPVQWVSAVSWDARRVQLSPPSEESGPTDVLTEA